MNGYVVKMYVLTAEWKMNENNEYSVLYITDDRKKAEKMLQKISMEKCHVRNESCNTAVFSIIEHNAEISDTTKYQISRAVDIEYRMQDIRYFLDNLYENGSVEKWKYEFILNNQEAFQDILRIFEKSECCDVPESSSMEYAVNEVLDNVQLNSGNIEYHR